MPRRADPDPPLPNPVTMASAIAAGLTPDQVRQRVRSGRWRQVQRGVYSTHDLDADAPEHVRRQHDHRMLGLAARQRHPGLPMGYATAAVAHGLPLWQPLPDAATLLVADPRDRATRAAVRLRYAPVPSTHLVPDGSATTPARTWVDIARTMPLADALAAGDAGLRSGILRPAELRTCLDECRELRGWSAASRAFGHLDARRESPAESASWAYFVEHDLPLPAVQVPVRDHRGVELARLDFLWKDARLVGECDGRLKYQTAEDLYQEKRREDWIRGMGRGFGFIRWGPRDLFTDRLAERLDRLIRG